MYREARHQEEFMKQVQEYLGDIEKMKSQESDSTGGAVFLNVVRGKLSEGISMSDEACRCVIMVGIPYSYLKDTRVVLKKFVLNTREEER